jgi:CSLREA domain-containing protein
VAVLLSCSPALASTITVSTTADELTNDGNCSLREALEAANNDTAVDACAKGSGADTVVVPSGSYDFSSAPALTGTDDDGLKGDLDIKAPTTIQGAGAVTTTVDAESRDRVFDVRFASVTISGLTIRGGFVGSMLRGGGIRNTGTLTLSGDIVTDNSAYEGGGVAQDYGRLGVALTVRDSTISHNHGDGDLLTPGSGKGGGILVENSGSTASITRSLIADNTSLQGGGVWLGDGASVVAAQSSIEGNAGAFNGGGGIYSKGDLTLTDVSVARNTPGPGAGIYNKPSGASMATLTRVLVSGNNATESGGAGGGIFNEGPMTITQSTISGNTAGTTGGGIQNVGVSGKTLATTQSTITGNTATDGDGVYNSSAGQATLTNVTVTDNGENSTKGQGGGIYNSSDSTMSLANVTLTGNEASFTAGDGGNLYNANATAGALTAKDTIIANPLTSGNCNDTNKPTSLGNNLGFDPNGDTHPCFSAGGGNVFGDPLLGPLQNNGGPTQTEAISMTSAALDKGAGCPTIDQRGFPRPQGPACDIGAFELDYVPPQTTITSGPGRFLRSTVAKVSFASNEAGSRFECSLDAAAFTSCSSPKQYAGLSQGAHRIRVRALDRSGNVDPTPAVRSFTVDTRPPQTTVTSGPSGPTRDRTPTFAFKSSEPGSTFQCALDAGAYHSCSSPHTTAQLGFGSHKFRVRARDRAGNLDPTPAVRSFSVIH